MLLAAAFLSKLVLYTASLAGVGLALHRSMGIDMPRRAYLWAGAAIALATTVQFLFLSGQLAGSAFGALSPDALYWTWMSAGPSSLALLSGAALLCLAAFIRPPVLSLAPALLVSAAYGLSGHTAGLETPGIAPLVTSLHVLIAGFWIMAPVSLWPDTEKTDALVLQRTRRFSFYARGLIPLLFISGPFLLWRIAGGVSEIIYSDYGRLILAKFVLAGVALALGAVNMLIVTRRIATSPADGRAALRTTLRVDAVLFAGILLLISTAITLGNASADMGH